MDCRRAKKTLVEYADGGLSRARRDEIGLHLESCEDCRALLGMLEVSREALDKLERVSMPDDASRRTLSTLKSQSASASAGGFFRSPRVITAAGIATAVLVGLAIVVGLFTGGKAPNPKVSQNGSTTTPVSSSGGAEGLTKTSVADQTPTPPVGSLVMPVARATSNNYDNGSMKTMAEGLDIKKQFAQRYTLSDAVSLRILFRQKLADLFVELGGDGPTLEAMISYIQVSEPVLLPCYAEKALFGGQNVIIVGLSGPPRGGNSKMLSRTEFWVMSPDKFVANPDSCIVWWGQSLQNNSK
ncbi:MAG TPA: zf-HC2 domain-containing protein [Candidatus Anoxymicrobiaceae bacterium]